MSKDTKTMKQKNSVKTTSHQIARRRRADYDIELAAHPSIKVLRRQAQKQNRKPLKRGVPRMIALAMQDEEIAEFINALRSMNRYELAVDDLVNKRLNNKSVSTESEIKLIRSGSNIEHRLNRDIQVVARRVRESSSSKAYAEAASTIPIPDEILEDLPEHMTQSELAAIKYVGWGPKHPIWQQIATNVRKGHKKPLSPSKVNEVLKKIEKGSDELVYKRAPRHLVEEGILTLGGSQADPNLIALLLFLIYVLHLPVVPWWCQILPGRIFGCDY